MIDAVANPLRRSVVRQTTVRMPAELAKTFTRAYQDIYGPRGGARWVEEALEVLLGDRNFVLKVGAGEEAQSFDTNKGISLTPKCQTLLENGIRRYRSLDPLVEGVGSQILRAAIKHRLTVDSAPPATIAPNLEVKTGRLGRKASAK